MTVAPIQSPTPGQAVARPDVQAAAAVALAAVAAKLAALTAQPVTPVTPAANGAKVDEALRAAAQRAASRQGSMAPLLADLEQAARNPGLPPQVQAAVRQVLALRTATDRPPTAADVKLALVRSGLFLEASLPAAAPSTQPAAQDLKAALLVFRQVTRAWAAGASAGAEPNSAPPAGSPTLASPPMAGPRAPVPRIDRLPTPPAAVATPSPSVQGRDHPAASPSAPAPPATVDAPSHVPAPEAAPQLGSPPRPVASAASGDTRTAPGPPAPAAAPQTPPSVRPSPATPPPLAPDLAAPAVPAQAQQAAAVPRPLIADRPPPALEAGSLPPPYRNGPIRAQPPESPSLPAHAAPAVVAQRLLQETDAALARQELHQLASLPVALDTAGGARLDGPKWMFEAPFATAQGSAVAQFEISRDGGGGEAYVGAGTPVWSARFSFDMEPMGPVHAQVTLSGVKAGVTLWAEREPTVARLRAMEEHLNAALRSAAFEPEVAVRPGAPPRPAPPPEPGRFVDRAT